MATEQTDEDRDANGRIMPGFALWQYRKSHGRNVLYDDAEQLWTACVEYFEWANANPLLETKGFAFQGKVTKETFPIMRAFTLRGLCIHLKIAPETWRDWRKNRADLGEVIGTVEDIIYEQKFSGAAAGLLNANIIARDLGLADRVEQTGKDGKDLIPEKTATDLDLAKWIAFTLSKADCRIANQRAAEAETPDQKGT